MSNAPYLQTPAGAASFGGTGANSVLLTAPADLDDADPNDILHIRSSGSLLWETPGEMIEVVARLRANGTTIHTMQFGAIGGDDSPRDVTLEWWLTVGASDTCRVEGSGVVTGAGGQGPNRADRNPITRAQAFVLPVTFDITIQIDEVDTAYTPDSSFFHKVEPTLSDAAGTASVVSVNTKTGAVTLVATDVGAIPVNLIGLPTLLWDGDSYPARPVVFFPVLYTGPDEPTIANTGSPSFSAGNDFWWKTS